MNIKRIVRLYKLAVMIENGGYEIMEMNVKALLNEEQRKQKQKILNDLKAIQKGFEMTAPQEKGEYNPTFTKLDTKQMSDDDIASKAKQNLVYYEAGGKKEINDKYNTSKGKINEQISEVNTSAKADADKLSEQAKDLKESTKNSMINKNIARSSIYQNMMTDIEKEEMQQLQDLKADTDNKINQLNEKLQLLDNERQNALELFDISYAVKVQDQMDKIKKEISNYNDAVTKYNNSIEQKENDLKAKYDEKYQNYVSQIEDRNRKVMEFMQKYGYGTISNKLNSQKYNVALDYLNTMDKDVAMEILTENDDFKNELGENLFNQLIEAIKNRKE
ncbi:MAG: hypothetical protein ACI4TX_03535 [Christensenellales bacterium]